MKTTYKTSVRKKKIREEAFSHMKGKKLIGLAGPDIQDYVDFCKRHGYTSIDVWENNGQMLLLQLPKMQQLGIRYHFGDILQAPLQKDTIYDLDFCCSISRMGPHLRKFRKNFVLTVALRPVGLDDTIDGFLYFRGETALSYTYDPATGSGELLTDVARYKIQKYYEKEVAWPMLTLYPIGN